jgi:hypothetical protein
MTKEEARKTLGITRSTGRSKIALAYEEKCKKFRLQMVPGMPKATRHKAYGKLAKLSIAWQTLQTAPTARRPQRKKAHRKSPTRRPASANRAQRPRTLGEAWEDVVFQMPFSEPVVVTILVAVVLLTLTLLLVKVL